MSAGTAKVAARSRRAELGKTYPSSDQVPPNRLPVAPILVAVPPSAGTLRSSLPAWNASHLPSGEKNGRIPPSVPRTSSTASEPM
jgi:hypothetical protein